jgi:7-cyano-7-deazaguanosine (preQ0) biosynthesis protein QueE
MLAINEVYGPTYQGEGRSAGKPVMFIRTAGCNLACVFCDTPQTWNWIGTNFQHPNKFDPRKEVHKMVAQQVFDQLVALSPGTRAVVVSGGEPLLQQHELIPLLTILRQNNYWIEVETNGTIAPIDSVIALVNQFNCSPKLTNSGPDNPLNKREVAQSLITLASLPTATFKFVIVTNEDQIEVMDLITRYKLHDVYLMAEGKTRAEQLARQDNVCVLCEQLHVHFSPRLHVLQYGNKRGV